MAERILPERLVPRARSLTTQIDAILIVNIALSFTLIPLLGLWGAALATTLATLMETALLPLTVWRKLGTVMVVFWPVASEKEAV